MTAIETTRPDVTAADLAVRRLLAAPPIVPIESLNQPIPPVSVRDLVLAAIDYQTGVREPDTDGRSLADELVMGMPGMEELEHMYRPLHYGQRVTITSLPIGKAQKPKSEQWYDVHCEDIRISRSCWYGLGERSRIDGWTKEASGMIVPGSLSPENPGYLHVVDWHEKLGRKFFGRVATAQIVDGAGHRVVSVGIKPPSNA